jgi:dUTP pyrophosphatase
LTQLLIKKLADDAVIPTRGSPGSIGFDLYAYLPPPDFSSVYDSLLERQQRKRSVHFGEVVPVRTGISVSIPDGHYGRIAPRSGLAAKFGCHVLAGVVDADYRGELIVLLTVLSKSPAPLVISHGDRVAQLIIERASTPDVEVVDSLDDTSRGSGGFGSTGRN